MIIYSLITELVEVKSLDKIFSHRTTCKIKNLQYQKVVKIWVYPFTITLKISLLLTLGIYSFF